MPSCTQNLIPHLIVAPQAAGPTNDRITKSTRPESRAALDPEPPSWEASETKASHRKASQALLHKEKNETLTISADLANTELSDSDARQKLLAARVF